jgi:hypothetical protein
LLHLLIFCRKMLGWCLEADYNIVLPVYK